LAPQVCSSYLFRSFASSQRGLDRLSRNAVRAPKQAEALPAAKIGAALARLFDGTGITVAERDGCRVALGVVVKSEPITRASSSRSLIESSPNEFDNVCRLPLHQSRKRKPISEQRCSDDYKADCQLPPFARPKVAKPLQHEADDQKYQTNDPVDPLFHHSRNEALIVTPCRRDLQRNLRRGVE
jgi:hypothetical protein